VQPRIQPISLDDADAPTREIFDRIPPPMRTMNVLRTFANHPDLMGAWLGFGAYLLRSSKLEPRLRELVVLRKSGVLDADLQRLTQGPDAEGWSVAEASALRATDQLIERHTLGDANWTDLTAHFTTQQILDLIFLVGQYQLVASALNALRVERDDGLNANELPFPMPAE